MDKSNRIILIKNRLKEIEKEKKQLDAELQSLLQMELEANRKKIGTKAYQKTPETNDEKIELFLKLFRCRKDVYPKYWENRYRKTNGFSPACKNEWVKERCGKPRVKCSECKNSEFIPLDEKAVSLHLEGKHVIGTYAICENDNCNFLAADFDEKCWKDDVLSYKFAAREFGIDVAIEISKSGNGAHAWMFFSEPVKAYLARRLGTIIMAKASSNRYALSLESYDRFFPNQDFIPKGGFGNLIALPMQYKGRQNGKTVFVDDGFQPFDNQWEYLANRYCLTEKDIKNILDDILTAKDQIEFFALNDKFIQDAEQDIEPISGEIDETTYPYDIIFNLGAKLSIQIDNLPSKLVSALKRTATFANPRFFELQRMRFSTWKTPRYICCAELSNNTILLPRGTLDTCREICESAGAKVLVEDKRISLDNFDINFQGQLRSEQEMAANEMIKYNYGVLVAPPGIGKTVIGCYLLKRRKVPTLVLVHRKQLIDQWKSQLSTLLGIQEKEIGVYGSGRKKLSGKIDIAMLQSISRMENIKSRLSVYEQIIVDECHHIPAVSFEAVLNEIPARYIIGLTATPYRKDGHQAIIHMQCGPVRHEISESITDNLKKRVIVRETRFSISNDSTSQPPLHEVWEFLVNDKSRLELISNDVVEALETGRFPLVLSERIEHLQSLKKVIDKATQNNNSNGFLFIGDMGKKARRMAFDEINDLLQSKTKPYILSTGSLFGEGFDLPELDTLFIAMPFSFKGRMIQYAGRLHRDHPHKKEVIIYDYLDMNSGLTISMFKKRVSAYKTMGYNFEYPQK